jgi:glycosyltransferase involved in cell wall biosynthesis
MSTVLDASQQPVRPFEEEAPKISVLIGTRNHAESLAVTLSSLAADESRTQAEIIVVDNASADHTTGVVRGAARRSSRPIVLLTEPDIGLSAARNAGVRAALGEVLAFTDDDVTVANGWLDALAASFAPGVVAVGGRVIPRFPGTRPAWLGRWPNPATLWDYGTTAFDMGPEALPLGANMAFRADVLRRRLPEPFDLRLGHMGAMRVGGEESHLAAELLRAGHRIVYCPDAVVEHRLTPERVSYDGTRTTFILSGIGVARYERLIGVPHGSLARRLTRCVRTIRAARALEKANSHLPREDTDRALAEFEAYRSAARHVEIAFNRSQRLVTSIIQWLM